MPVEGQWRRARTPLGRRDRVALLAIAGVAALAGLGGGLYAALGPSSTGSGEGCVVVTVPSTIGANRIERCGAAARRFCRNDAAGNTQIADACRRAGYGKPEAAGS